MVFSSAALLDVVGWALDVCQVLACNPEFLERSEVVDLLCCIPFQLIARAYALLLASVRRSQDGTYRQGLQQRRKERAV
ncbi:hypothetical protein KC19_7G049400 [Ceratodon purpureus]|uniref:Uncharacterized protein n=1 Tax=Ceratodon purpureus TaxID=3225 RepID=A0A8T0H7Q8_CERPU|nr:hypothetical protein KC19_7G049400 [Ceratodon purpureus]